MVKLPLLTKKMLRDMHRSLSAYLISGFIVMIGVVGYSVLSITCENLAYAQNQFYAESGFADGFADVKMAPKAVERRLARIKGISVAQGRLVTLARVAGDRDSEAELKLYSYEDAGLCLPLIQTGTAPGKGELLLGADFMKAHGLTIGDSISLVIDGRRSTLTISGTALSPETVYMVKDIVDMVPDAAKFDAGYMTYRELSGLMDAGQQANSFVFLMDGSKTFPELEDELDSALRVYGVSGTYPRKDQFSHAMLAAEMEQISRMASSVPFLFLGIAGIIISITLNRLVVQQRVQIGTLMALGMEPRRLLWHYSGYGALLGFVGGLLGGAAGIYAANGMSDFYRIYFKIPSYGFILSQGYFFGGLAVATFACGLIAWCTARGLQKLTPAVALHPAPPQKIGITPLERLPGLFAALTVTGRIAVRGLFRSPRKVVLSVLGVACAYMISAALLSMYSMLDVFLFDYLEVTQRQDVIVSFARPVAEADALRAVRSPEIELAEGVAELPVTLIGPKDQLDCTLMGLEPDAQLYRIYDKAGGQILVGESGLVISRHMATILGVQPGESISVKLSYPKEHTQTLTVTALAEQYLGSSAYTSRMQLARLGEPAGAITSLYLKATPELAPVLRDQLKDAGLVAGVQNRIEKVNTYRTMMGSFNSIFFSMALLGVGVGFAVVYTGSLISFEELKREVSTLLALGLSSSQAVEVISVGQWIIAFGGMLLGLPMTMAVSRLMSTTMSTKLYSIPDFVNGSALLMAAGLTMLSVWLGTAVIYRKIKRTNPIELLRERE